jgi:hypothetical protein
VLYRACFESQKDNHRRKAGDRDGTIESLLSSDHLLRNIDVAIGFDFIHERVRHPVL